jgi:hypothetical protein
MLVTETGRSSAVPSGTITRLDGSLTEAGSAPEDAKADDPAKAKAAPLNHRAPRAQARVGADGNSLRVFVIPKLNMSSSRAV